MNKKKLLTGGAGFIGSHFADAFLAKNYSLKILNNFSTGNKNNIKHILNDVELIERDICDSETIASSSYYYGDGTQSRDFTFIKNVVNANILAVENSSDKNLIMNYTCNVFITLNELVKEINFTFG